jgi:ubiquinone/menaquinone biosynthesis C-methylase UbiE
MNDVSAVPNHHAHHPQFSGAMGVAAALSMISGRKGDARLAVRLSGLHADEAVVDIGCGPGAAVRYAARIGATVIGIDPAAVMLRTARLLTRPSPRVRYTVGSAEDLSLPDGSADVAWSIATVHHWSHIDAALGQVHRVLKAGGRLVVIEKLTQPGARGLASHGWTEAQADAFAERCTAHGFGNVRVEKGRGRGPALSVVALRRS